MEGLAQDWCDMMPPELTGSRANSFLFVPLPWAAADRPAAPAARAWRTAGRPPSGKL